MELWHYLIILGVLSFACELFTSGFVFGSMGIGFLLSSMFSYFDSQIKWQVLVFSIGVIITYFFIRPLISKYGYQTIIKTNQDALINKEAIVTKEITEKTKGRIKVDGDDWSAISSNNERIEVGTKVKIVSISSIVLTVKPLKIN